MNIKLLLQAYNIPLSECKLYINRHPSSEPKEVREYFKNKTINGFKEYLSSKFLTVDNINTIINNFNVFNKWLEKVSTGFNDFFLFNSLYYFQNYKNKTLEEINKKNYQSALSKAATRSLNYLEEYYKNKNFYDLLIDK